LRMFSFTISGFSLTNLMSNISWPPKNSIFSDGSFSYILWKVFQSEKGIVSNSSLQTAIKNICKQLFFHHRLQICFSVAIAYAFITKKLPIPVIKQGREYISRVATQIARSILRTSWTAIKGLPFRLSSAAWKVEHSLFSADSHQPPALCRSFTRT